MLIKNGSLAIKRFLPIFKVGKLSLNSINSLPTVLTFKAPSSPKNSSISEKPVILASILAFIISSIFSSSPSPRLWVKNLFKVELSLFSHSLPKLVSLSIKRLKRGNSSCWFLVKSAALTLLAVSSV